MTGQDRTKASALAMAANSAPVAIVRANEMKRNVAKNVARMQLGCSRKPTASFQLLFQLLPYFCCCYNFYSP